MINEMRAYRSLDSRNTDPYVHVPSGRVVVASNLPDGSLGVSTLQFGVNPSLPQESNSRLTEISDEISRVSKTGAHRVKLGGFLNEERSESGSFNNALGTYTFNSLADFEAGNAASFTRTVARRDRNARSVNAALYLADSWRQSPRLQLGIWRRKDRPLSIRDSHQSEGRIHLHLRTLQYGSISGEHSWWNRRVQGQGVLTALCVSGRCNRTDQRSNADRMCRLDGAGPRLGCVSLESSSGSVDM
jgi:hypothetical protein